MTDEKRPLEVFLCHAHDDQVAVRALYKRLVKDGIDAWLDEEKLFGGANWEYEIRRAVRESDVVIVCLSKQFSAGGFRQKEVQIALDEAALKPKEEIFIIPVRLEECDVPEQLKIWHWLDLFRRGGYYKLMGSLKSRGLQLQRAKIEIPTPDEAIPNLAQELKPEQTKNIFVSVDGNVQGNIIIGNENTVESLPGLSEKERAGRESKEKTANEIEENESFEKPARERVEAQARSVIPVKSRPAEAAGEHPAQELAPEKKFAPSQPQANAKKHFERGWPPLLVMFTLVGIILVGTIVLGIIFIEQPGNGFLKKTATPTQTLMPTLTILPSMTFTRTPTLTSTLTQLPGLTSTATFSLTPDLIALLTPTTTPYIVYCNYSISVNGSLLKTNCVCNNDRCACEQREYDRHGSFKSDTSFNGSLAEINKVAQKNGGSCK